MEPFKQAVLTGFQHLLTGRLAKGIVHNLNSPLQILSMQLELVKAGLDELGGEGAGRLMERIIEMERMLHRIETLTGAVSGRKEGDVEDLPVVDDAESRQCCAVQR